MARSQSKIPLILLIGAQIVCGVFFLWDVLADFREDGYAIASNIHLVVEILAAFALFAAIVFETRYLRRLLQHQAHLQESVSLATSAMHDIVLELFDQWKLTASEKDVAMLMVKGLRIGEIAGVRGSAEGTIKAHLNSIYRKSGTNSRAELLSLIIDPLMVTPLITTQSETAARPKG